MSNRPGTLCHLEKGKILDTQVGFVDTYNWMVDYINNLKGEDGIKLDNAISDHPVIKLDAEFGGGNVYVGDSDAEGATGVQQKSVQVVTLEPKDDEGGEGGEGEEEKQSQDNVIQLYGFGTEAASTSTVDVEHQTIYDKESGGSKHFLVRSVNADGGTQLGYEDVTFDMKGKQLTIKVDGSEVGTYDGSEEKEIDIQTGGSSNKTLTLTKNGSTVATYDGSEDVTAEIGGGSGKFNVHGTDGSYGEVDGDLYFETMTNSNVKVTVNGSTIKIGVFYI